MTTILMCMEPAVATEFVLKTFTPETQRDVVRRILKEHADLFRLSDANDVWPGIHTVFDPHPMVPYGAAVEHGIVQARRGHKDDLFMVKLVVKSARYDHHDFGATDLPSLKLAVARAKDEAAKQGHPLPDRAWELLYDSMAVFVTTRLGQIQNGEPWCETKPTRKAARRR
mgnify:CR=1 FL=1